MIIKTNTMIVKSVSSVKQIKKKGKINKGNYIPKCKYVVGSDGKKFLIYEGYQIKKVLR